MAQEKAQSGLMADCGRFALYTNDHYRLTATASWQADRTLRLTHLLDLPLEEFVGIDGYLLSTHGRDSGDEPDHSDRVPQQCLEAGACSSPQFRSHLLLQASGHSGADGAVFPLVRCCRVPVRSRSLSAAQECPLSQCTSAALGLSRRYRELYGRLPAD